MGFKDLKSIALEEALLEVESTLDGMVFMYKDGTINQKTFDRLNEDFDAFLKKIGFPEKTRKDIEFSQWKRVINKYNILLRIELTEDDKKKYGNYISKEETTNEELN